MERLNTPQKTAGIALILVLGMLVLLSAIVVAFLTSVTTDLSASKSYENQTSTRELADSAVNLAIAQIRQASTIPKVAWISQPGLIRTFDDNGKALNAYKLYSDDTLQVSGAFDPAKIEIDPTWKIQPNLYTDLNSPVFTDSIANFPIIDGNSMVSHGNGEMIYDANGDSKPDIEGFSVDSQKIGYVSGKPLSPFNNPVAMPVKWLYLLKDGSLLPAKAGEGGKFDVQIGSGNVKPTSLNPIVARVAFWTDDETTKVNINTASEGTFWDSPIACSYPPSGNPTTMDPDFDSTKLYESDLAWRSAAQGEYQRYPGHPATTSLSPILGTALCDALGIPINPTKGSDRAKLVQTITDIVPRVTDDKVSSLAGTGRYAKNADGTDVGNGAGSFKKGARVTVDADRLFATPDELLFSSKFLNAKRALQTNNDGKLLQDSDLRKLVNRTRFFLTATSRAPEVNLFNKPRIAVWPINLDPANRTSFDKLFAFCSVIGNYDVSKSAQNTSLVTAPVFFFSRSDPTRSTVDLAPGTRNYKLYEYLQSLTGQKFPGYGGSTFALKYGTDRDQILTEIFDYIRSTNLVDVSEATSANDIANTAFSMAKGSTVGSLYLQDAKRGQVVPTFVAANATRGFGRMATISEMGLVIMKTTKDTTARYEFTLIPELFSPAAGFSAMADDIRLSFANLNFTVTPVGGSPVTLFPSNNNRHEMYLPGRLPNQQGRSSKTGGYMGVGTLFEVANYVSSTLTYGIPTPTVPPNAHFTLPSASGNITVQGSVDVTITCDTSKSTEPLQQKFTFKFPPFTAPIPVFGLPGSGTVSEITAAGTTGYPASAGSTTKGSRLSVGGAPSAGKLQVNGFIFNSADIIYSLVPTGVTNAGVSIQGDMRLVAGLQNVPVSYFQPSKRYFDGTLQAHSLRKTYFSSASSTLLPGGAVGALFTNSPQASTNYSPDIPEGIPLSGMNSVVNSLGQAGDWDNGPALMPDGPFINKADEGVAVAGNKYIPYISDFFDSDSSEIASGTYFSPNRLMPSPVMFGSLSTGVKRGLPWQTLLFHPATSYFPGSTTHPGSVSPPDHLLLDLFWMPVVEPYAISEPFATAGKINLNYQLAPFSYITRDTGMRAVLQSSMVTALDPNDKPSGKAYILHSKDPNDGTDHSSNGVVTRQKVDVEQTMRVIADEHFKEGVNKPFISESEICDVPLVPVGITANQLASFWNKHNMTGDNSLERPYALLYPRLTTKSNSYTVHVRVQSLKKAAADKDQDIFKDGRDQVSGEFRGSFVIERYLDPNTAGFYPNGDPTQTKTDETDSTAVLGPYKFRVVNSKQFGQ